MDTGALRQKILDLAIRGKLVPQDPNDEPASVLLERIRAEKQQMVKDGKLKAKDIKSDTVIFKAEDNLHYEKFADGTVKCIEDEIPFDVPQGWEWSRLGSVSVDILYGLSNSAESTGTHKLLRITDIQDGKVDWSSVPFTTVTGKDDYLLKNNDIVFARTGATVGKSFLIKDVLANSVYASYLIRIRVNDNINPEYIYHFFNSECYWAQITKKSIGVGQPNCNGTSLRELFIPIPPSLQQTPIALAANKLLEISNIIEDRKSSLSGIVAQTKLKILDLAIRGKLVPQDPNDEPASVLLERIRAEKEELIKQGKIKRDKNESVIFKGDDNSYYEKYSDGTQICIDEEIPFDIPKSWQWTRLSNLVTKEIKRGKAPRYSEEVTDTLVFAQKCNLKTGGINIALAKYLDETILSKYSEADFLTVGDIVINSTGTGTLGRVGIIEEAFTPIVPDTHITVIRTSQNISSQYIYCVLKGSQPTLEDSGEGSTNQKELRPNILLNCLIPVPPLKEQEQIFTKVIGANYGLHRINEMIS